jgi:flagellar hook-length control protein FliK
VVKATTDSASSGFQPGRSLKAKAARKGTQAGFFAAILEKALNGPAAPEKTGKGKIDGLFPRLKFPHADKTRETGENPRPDRNSGKRKTLKIRRETRESGAQPQAERQILNAPLMISSSGTQASAEKTEKDLSREAVNAPYAGAVVKAAADTAPGENAAGVPAAVKSAVFPAAFQTPMFQAAADAPAAGPVKTPGEKTGAADAVKKSSAKQDASGAPRKAARETAPGKPEKTDAGVLVGETKPFYADEPKNEKAAQDIEIRVITRAGDERFEDSLRVQDERSVKESASGLLRRMREEGNEQIVKSARFILKDKNEGEIRLVLKPESFGEVRIRLSLQDNLIGGRIFVENESVREVFEQNMPDLASVFRENGLELSGMSVSVGNGSRRESEIEEGRVIAPRAGGTEKETPSAAAYEYYFVSNAINLMV